MGAATASAARGRDGSARPPPRKRSRGISHCGAQPSPARRQRPARPAASRTSNGSAPFGLCSPEGGGRRAPPKPALSFTGRASEPEPVSVSERYLPPSAGLRTDAAFASRGWHVRDGWMDQRMRGGSRSRGTGRERREHETRAHSLASTRAHATRARAAHRPDGTDLLAERSSGFRSEAALIPPTASPLLA